jgi:sugar lactone lactonase YvrE
MNFSPEGNLLKQVKLPAMCPTCPTWGGKDHDILYLTTARDRSQNPDPSDDGGHIFRFLPGVKGQAKNEFAG